MTPTVSIEHRDFRETLRVCAARGGVDLIVTSPPYPDARPGQYGGDTPRDFTWSDYQELGDLVFKALRPGGFAGVVIDGPVRVWRSKDIGSERSLIAFKLAIDWAERVGLRYVEHCAYKSTGTPGTRGDRWRSTWEPLHVFQRPGPGYFDLHAYEVRAQQGGVVQTAKRTRSGRGRNTVKRHVQRLEKALSTIIDGQGVVGDPDHPAVFAAIVAHAFVLCYSPPGATVCDPFVGSGTVAVAAVQHGRSFIGGDLGERPASNKSARARWADVSRDRAAAAIADVADIMARVQTITPRDP